MAEFDFISEREEYKRIHELCTLAEQTLDLVEKAKKCRDTLEEILMFIYEKGGRSYPANATLLEVIDSNVVRGFVDNNVILESLHYIRKLGMNAKHDLHIKKTQVQIAFDNLLFFTHYIVKKYDGDKDIDTIVLPKYMSEANTRKIYIDLYLKEAGWEVLEPNSQTVLPNGKVVVSGNVYPGKACCEIPVNGMNNASGIGFCDYVLYGKDGKPLAIVEAKKTSEEAVVGSEQVKTYGKCMEAVYGYVPVLYYTNGYEIFVIDGTYPSRRLMAFHSM